MTQRSLADRTDLPELLSFLSGDLGNAIKDYAERGGRFDDITQIRISVGERGGDAAAAASTNSVYLKDYVPDGSESVDIERLVAERQEHLVDLLHTLLKRYESAGADIKNDMTDFIITVHTDKAVGTAFRIIDLEEYLGE